MCGSYIFLFEGLTCAVDTGTMHGYYEAAASKREHDTLDYCAVDTGAMHGYCEAAAIKTLWINGDYNTVIMRLRQVKREQDTLNIVQWTQRLCTVMMLWQ